MRDIRLAIRSLAKAPGFSIGAIVTLALAIGATTVMFSAVVAVLFRPSPVRQPDELVIVWEKDSARHLEVVELTYRTVQAWAAHSRSFSQVAAIGSSTWPATLDHGGESSRVSSAGVSTSFFETLGVVPEVGRRFIPEDDEPGAPRVVVLSHRFWVSRFGADPSIVGRTIQLSPPHTVVGIMPDAFDFPRGTDYWTPVVPVIAASGGAWKPDLLERVGVLFVVARLREGVSPALAQEDLARVSVAVANDRSVVRFGSDVVVTPLMEHVLGPVRPALWALLVSVAILLLIGCANVSGLMMTRVSSRMREQAVRAALGATRWHLGAHWVSEMALLSAAGGLGGLALSVWGVRGIIALAPDDVAGVSSIAIDYRIAAFTFAVIVFATLLCSLAPVRHAWRPDAAGVLSDAARSTPTRQSVRARSALVILQIALTVVLLVAAGLVARSFANIRRIDIGFIPANVITMRVSPRTPEPSGNVWIATLLDRVSTLPDVESAGAVYLRPLALGAIGQETGVILDGQPLAEASAHQNPALNYQIATSGYFAAMRVPLVRGRLFDVRDGPASPRVVLVGESTSKRLWPGRDAIGQRLLMATHASDGSAAWRTVVGVVGDVRYRGINDGRLDIYDAPLQSVLAASDLVIRARTDPLRFVTAVQAEARRLDPAVVIDGVATMDTIVSRAIAPWRFSAWMFGLFAALAFVLATVGLFSLITLDVANRRHELAVRLALGAAPTDVCRLVLAAAVTRLVSGLSLGLVASLLATRAMGSLLFGVRPQDAATYAAVLIAVSVVVFTATYLPARRAGSIDPLTTLRH